MQFGISTHLYHDSRLSRDHLFEIADHGFGAVELFATRSHFDYHDARAIADLETWLREANLRMHSIHAPIVEHIVDGAWGTVFSTATTDEGRRGRAVREAEAALEVARRVPTRFLVMHLGTPTLPKPTAGDNNAAAARRSLEEIHDLAAQVGVQVAAEVIPNDLSAPAALVRMLEDEVELPGAGICLDFGHAFLMGDLVDAIETSAGHLITTHVHDNHGRADEHLAPFEGGIDWTAALMAVQKIGYEGTCLFELANSSTPRAVLETAQQVRRRFEQILGG